MFEHYFQAVGECGHERNFTWNRGIKKELKYVYDFCPVCSNEKETLIECKFVVKKYLDEVKELPKIV